MTDAIKRSAKDRLLSIIVPAHNETAVLRLSCERMVNAVRALPCAFELIYVDDGSTDGTWELIEELHKAPENRIRALRFTRNFGHQAAVSAGLAASRGDIAVIIDADLQDPPELIEQMLELWTQGYDIVYGKRKKREGESAFKLFTAFAYYRLLKLLSTVDIPLDTGDFRLIDGSVRDTLNALPEHNRFLRGMTAWAGFSAVPVEYERAGRAAGSSTYSLKKMLKLAGDGLLGFSFTPLRLPLLIGAVTLLTALIGLIWAAAAGNGQNALFSLLFLLVGLLFICVWVLGEYVGRIADESRGRPNYIIRQSTDKENE